MDNRPDSARGVDTGVAQGSCTLEERRVDGISVVAVTGVVDMLTAPDLEKAIAEAAKSSPTAVVVDMSAVEFLASAGMGVLIAAQDELAPAIRFAVVADGPARELLAGGWYFSTEVARLLSGAAATPIEGIELLSPRAVPEGRP